MYLLREWEDEAGNRSCRMQSVQRSRYMSSHVALSDSCDRTSLQLSLSGIILFSAIFLHSSSHLWTPLSAL